MRLSEFFRVTGNNIATFCKTVFGDNPDQYVEMSDDGALLVTAAKENLTREEAAELIRVSREMEKGGKSFQHNVDSSIQLDSDENGYDNTTSASERENAYRDSETMKSIRNKRIDTSAKNLENIPREAGGQERTRTDK